METNSNSSNLLQDKDAGRCDRSVNGNYDNVTVAMLFQLRKELEESFQNRIQKVEEKCNAILVKLPVLELRSEEVASLRRELEDERNLRSQNEKNFLECVDKLMHEIVQLKLKLIVLEERIEEKETHLPLVPFVSPPIRERSKSPSPDLEIILEVPTSSASKTLAPSHCRIVKKPTHKINCASIEFPKASSTSNTIKDDKTNPNKHQKRKLIKTKSVLANSTSAIKKVAVPRKGKRHGKVPSQPLLCLCGHQCPTQDAFRQHIRYHHVVKRRLGLMCKSCGKRFTFPSQLKLHMRGTHNKANAKMRMRLRSSKGPPIKVSKEMIKSANQVLKKAKKNTSSRFGLPEPTTIEHGIASGPADVDSNGTVKFSCKCGISFFTQKILQRHIREEFSLGKKFRCHLCTKKCWSLDVLRKHLITKHNRTREYCKGTCACWLCGQTFEKFEQLQGHRSTCHPSNEQIR